MNFLEDLIITKSSINNQEFSAYIKGKSLIVNFSKKTEST
jgi:hypothetical protein